MYFYALFSFLLLAKVVISMPVPVGAGRNIQPLAHGTDTRRMINARVEAHHISDQNSSDEAHDAHHHLVRRGATRWLGIRPTVRGTVMNPVDHPHGGGEGRAPIGRNPVSPWGKLVKALKTRPKKASKSTAGKKGGKA
ncbi:hypothetical protein CPB86DRAFT_785150 [Serendipita vermifera]|nr:hypothetical protein CPB86DRAFT_785150 [Serendipita vermifera]